MTDTINMLDLETLRSRRTEHRLKFLYLLYSNKTQVHKARYVTPVSRANTRFNHRKLLQEYWVCTDSFKYSFFPNTLSHWNRLPQSVVHAKDVVDFIACLKSVNA